MFGRYNDTTKLKDLLGVAAFYAMVTIPLGLIAYFSNPSLKKELGSSEKAVKKAEKDFQKYDMNKSKTLEPDEFARIYKKMRGPESTYIGSPKDTFDNYDKNNSKSLDSIEFVGFYK